MKKKHKSIWLRFDRVLAHDLLKQALILVVLFAVLFVVSYVLLSFSNLEWREFCRSHNLSKWLLPLYLLIDTNALNNLYINDSVHGWMLFASSLTYLAGLFVFNGMIISVMTNAISSRVERHNDGLIHYLKSGHYIILGYDDICPSILDSIFGKDPDAYILILTSASPQKVRERLKKNLGDSTVILISHRVTTLMQAECILVLDKGRIAELGSHDELMEKNGIYRRIYDMQMTLPDESALPEN